MSDQLLSSPERVEALLGRSGLDTTRLEALILSASSTFRSQTNQLIDHVLADSVTLDSRGGWALLLPELPVLAVASVTVQGEELASADYEWSADKGILRRLSGCWPNAYRVVDVVYDHGYETVPEDIQDAVAERVAIALTQRPGLLSVQLGATSYSFDKAGSTETWSNVVARYRVTKR